MAEFFQTRMGQTFYDVTMPKIADALTRIAKSLENGAPARCDGAVPTEEECAKALREIEAHNTIRSVRNYLRDGRPDLNAPKPDPVMAMINLNHVMELLGIDPNDPDDSE